MGRSTMSSTAYKKVHQQATSGGTASATAQAEKQSRQGQGMDPIVDPKGLPQYGPVRLSKPRFDAVGKLWRLTVAMPMPVERLFDTTASMQDNVGLTFESLPKSYGMLTSGNVPILGRYDVDIATSNFNDVQDGPSVPVLCRTQFEKDEKIAVQMTKLVPGRNGCGNGKEDSQFGLFAGAYLTAPRIIEYGMKSYHLTVSDEPTVLHIDLGWLRRIFGDDVLERIKETGFKFDAKSVPDTAQTVRDLQRRAHAFFLQVGDRKDVTDQWTELYGADHVVMLPTGKSGFQTDHLHFVEAIILGLTEGVLDLQTAVDFLREHKVDKKTAEELVRAVAHIPLGAQMLCPNFDKLPQAGDLFREKTDLWPIDPEEAAAEAGNDNQKGKKGASTTWL